MVNIGALRRELRRTQFRDYILSGMHRRRLEGLTVRMRRTMIPKRSTMHRTGGGSSTMRGSQMDRRIAHAINCATEDGARKCKCRDADKVRPRQVTKYLKDAEKMGLTPLASQVAVWDARKGVRTWIDDVFVGEDARGPYTAIVERKTGYCAFVTRNLSKRSPLIREPHVEFTHLNLAALQAVYGARMFEKCYPELPPVRSILVCYPDNTKLNTLSSQLIDTTLTWIDVVRLGWYPGRRGIPSLWRAL